MPWSGVSSLIGYRGKLWFANSVKFVNHNSADLYSFDPGTGTTRYEKHIFSQDAGHPVVAKGLLYWPFEDSRFSPGHGEFMVTNGNDWNWHLIPKGRAFHTQVMQAQGDRLYAGISAWVGKIVVSDDGGTSWRDFYVFPTPDRRVSRITAMASLKGRLFAGVTTWYDNQSPKLLMQTKDGMSPVPDWPAGAAVDVLSVHKGWVYAANEGPKESVLWRTNGIKVERVGGPLGVVNALASDGKILWAITAGKGAGALWRSEEGLKWIEVQKFKNARPLDVAVMHGQPFVGLLSDQGGELWGALNKKPIAMDQRHPSLPPKLKRPEVEISTALNRLDNILRDSSEYPRLRFAMRPLVAGQTAEISLALAKRLRGPFPKGTSRMFGRRQIPNSRMAHWYLLWGIAHNGRGRVPLRYLREHWTAKPNRAEKYIVPTLAALWAVRELGQKDDKTIAALILRLDFKSDPKWLTGDVVGALTDLTGKRFGYDRKAWQQWWRTRNRP
ncbi:MAG: hypothetical protein GKS01_08645 [Alphaproteobacteria bacterium]|nr:hypothetical protein [Alphaproteobacteria bacterium]